MSKQGQRDYLVFGVTLRKCGLEKLWVAAQESQDTKPLVDEIARRVPDRFPDGYRVALVADLASLPSSVPQEGLAIRVEHNSFGPLFGPVPLTPTETA